MSALNWLGPTNTIGWSVEERPMCAVCGYPVDEIHRMDDPIRCVLMIVVRCHGEQEHVELTEDELRSADGLRLGGAFEKKLLAEEHSRV